MGWPPIAPTRLAEEANARKRSSPEEHECDRAASGTFPKLRRCRPVEPDCAAELSGRSFHGEGPRHGEASGIPSTAYPQAAFPGDGELQTSLASDHIVNSGRHDTAGSGRSRVRGPGASSYGLAPDGNTVRDAAVSFKLSLNRTNCRWKRSCMRGVTEVAWQHRWHWPQAPARAAYDGPVLFERAAAPIVRPTVGRHLWQDHTEADCRSRLHRAARSERVREIASTALRSRREWMDVVDDPTQADWRGHTLLGHYEYDMEGVAPKPLALVEKGVLKTFLLTRTPVVKGFDVPNGRCARMPEILATGRLASATRLCAPRNRSRRRHEEEEADRVVQAAAISRTGCWCGRSIFPPRPPLTNSGGRPPLRHRNRPGPRRVVSEPPLFVSRVSGWQGGIVGAKQEVIAGLSTRSFLKDIIAASDEKLRLRLHRLTPMRRWR